MSLYVDIRHILTYITDMDGGGHAAGEGTKKMTKISIEYYKHLELQASKLDAAATDWDHCAAHASATATQRRVYPLYAADCRRRAAEFRADIAECRKYDARLAA